MYKALDLWLPAYVRQLLKGKNSPSKPVHLLLCVADHFEPLHDTDKKGALQRLAEWRRLFPEFQKPFADSDGVRPRHTFFYPIEQYDPELLEPLAELCRESCSEVEIHLHHDRDTAENLKRTLQLGVDNLARHGLLSKDRNGKIRYGFVHGNWALNHSHPEGRNCGVISELSILRETGCYADFTFPSAPHPTQTRIINALYYAKQLAAPKSHDKGVPVRVGSQAGEGDLLLVQGPLGLNWQSRKLGLFPRIENGDLTEANPPTMDRLKIWMDSHIHVQGKPEWIFIKLHTHGALPRNCQMLLGEPMLQFHQLLASFNPSEVMFHYVSAREMVNILHAAEAGESGSPGLYRDYELRPLSR